MLCLRTDVEINETHSGAEKRDGAAYLTALFLSLGFDLAVPGLEFNNPQASPSVSATV